MRVALDTTYALRAPLSGTGIYISRVAEALTELGVDVIRMGNEGRRSPAGGGMASVRNLLADTAWSGLTFPRRARTEGADLIHHTLPGVLRSQQLPQVLTVFDLAFERFPQHFDTAFRVYAQRVHRAAAHQAEAVIAISETTRRETIEIWGLDPTKVITAPLGPGQGLTVPPERRPTHFLYVGDDEARKDLPTLLAGYAEYRELAGDRALPLVLAGAARSSAEGVRVEASVNGERLGELLADAVALVHPAVHEGFGLTILEAMTAGVPVIAARSEAAVEVAESAAELIDPGDGPGFAQAMLAFASNPVRRATFAVAGRLRAAAFSWERCAQAHVEAYALALGR